MRLTKPGQILVPLLLGSLFTFAVGRASAQTQPVRARIIEAVDETNLVQLRGNVHPLARAEFDQGVVDDSQPMNRMLLLLQRSPEQETTLRQLMDDQQNKSSANFHAWLTPEQFGKNFGPADEDIQTVTDWLTSHGFQVNKVSRGRTVIEFSGNVGQVRNAFHTEIHRLLVKGEEHVANVSDPQIPVVLTPVVAGVVSLHDFRKQAHVHRVGTFRRVKATGEVKPLLTTPSGCGSNLAMQCLALGPADFAKIYNSAPLLNAGTPIDGTGESIAIVGRTNINIADVQQFRSLFGLPANFTSSNIILNGPDPGNVGGGEETEADLDIQWAGAVAPMAKILFVVTETPQSTPVTNPTDGVDLSALYIVDNNLAPVMSDSFGSCESAMGATGNAFYNAMWEQAAAQGITVVVAAGDNGSAGCDPTTAQPNAATQGLAVSGTASTPFNVAMGGTDFDQVGKTSTFWNTTNSTLPYTGQSSLTQLSAVGYIPETTWNDTCASGGQASNCTASTISTDQQNSPGVDVAAGSGGPSNCAFFTNAGACAGGYPKPSWQNGVTGVPSDGARDIPDVSLFASDGNHGSSYAVCQADANTGPGSSTSSCDLNSPFLDFQLIGGTSGATPTFAGIMALVNQQTGQRQGNANYVLYGLASRETFTSCNSTTVAPGNGCVFYDITNKGNNSVACVGGSPNCSNTNSGQFGIMATATGGTTPAFISTPGYDLATGLGSVNIANLLGKWNSVIRTTPTVTLMSNTASPVPHGTLASFTVTVSGSAAGDVSLIAQPSGFPQVAIGPFTLSGSTKTFSTNLLPGGTYPVIASYGGSATLAPSNSPSVNVTVGTERSTTTLSFVTFDANNNPIFQTSGAAVAYGSPYVLRVDVTNNAGTQCATTALVAVTPIPCPTGNVSITDNGKPLKDFNAGNSNSANLNNQGFLEDQPVQLPAGSHPLVATYAGDNSFSGSASPTNTVTITQAGTTIAVTSSPTSIASGGTVTLTATVSTQSSGVAPGGALTAPVQFLNGTTPISGTITLNAVNGPASNASLTATMTTTLSGLGIPDTPSPWRPNVPQELIWLLGCSAALYGLFVWKMPRARRRGYAYAGLAVFALAVAGIAGCGGGGGSSKTPQMKTVTITAKFSGDGNYTSSSGTTTVTIQ
jgi:subtilase family serine protease